MFYGRNKEIDLIKTTIKNKGSHILIYGNRRVGKTTLVNHTLSLTEHLFISYECIKTGFQENVKEFVQLLFKNELVPSYLSFDNPIKLFQYLDSLNKQIVILIDEYPYLYAFENKEYVDSIFQKIMDNYCHNINLIISGSHIGLMKGLSTETNPLFGRFSLVIHLQEMNYLEASLFYPQLSSYEKVAYYAIFGGSPFVLSNLDYSKTVTENIINSILNPLSAINVFISEAYTSDIGFKDKANNIFNVIKNGRCRYSHLEELLKLSNNGYLSKQLKVLVNMNYISKNKPINKLIDDKKASYQISNNLLRFYYTYVYGKMNIINLIGSDNYFLQYIKESLNTFITYRFEDVAKQYFSLLAQKGIIKNVSNIGTYYYDDVKNKKNGEFDVTIEFTDGTYDIIEVKYHQDKISNKIIKDEIEQIKQIKELKIKNYGFVSINGFKENNAELKYQISGGDLYLLSPIDNK